MSDGTFGATADERPLEPELVEAIENHRFDPLTRLYWRNAKLDFRSVDGAAARASTRSRASPAWSRRARPTITRRCAALARDAEIAALRAEPRRGAAVVGSLPDPRFPQGDVRNSMRACSARFSAICAAPTGRLPVDWVAGHVAGSTAPTAISTR